MEFDKGALNFVFMCFSENTHSGLLLALYQRPNWVRVDTLTEKFNSQRGKDFQLRQDEIYNRLYDLEIANLIEWNRYGKRSSCRLTKFGRQMCKMMFEIGKKHLALRKHRDELAQYAY